MVLSENNFVLARSREHKFILETMAQLEEVLRISSLQELIPQLKKIIEPFRDQVMLHHELEEQVIFQAALEAIPSARIVSLVLRLQKEHGIFSAAIDSILFNLWHVEIDDILRRKIEKEVNQLALMIKKHSLAEVKELFPLLSNNGHCCELIVRYSARTG
jgi:ribosome-associated translation inhibitor RaiA